MLCYICNLHFRMTLNKDLSLHFCAFLAIIAHSAVQSSTRILIHNNILFADTSNNVWYNKAQSRKPYLAAMASNGPGLGPIHVTIRLLKPVSGSSTYLMFRLLMSHSAVSGSNPGWCSSQMSCPSVPRYRALQIRKSKLRHDTSPAQLTRVVKPLNCETCYLSTDLIFKKRL